MTRDLSRVLMSFFSTNYGWNPSKGHPSLEVFLSRAEEEFFEIIKKDLRHSSLSKKEWGAIRFLADDMSIVIKKANKGLSDVV